jgi:hypothetical protein
MSDRIRIIKHEPVLGAACDLATLAYFPGPGLGYFAGLEEAMKLNQPREAMPLTVWIALAALAFWSVAYLVGIWLFDDLLALFSEKK